MEIKDTDKIIMARKDILPLKFPVQQSVDTGDNPFQKPRGLWYAIGKEWIEWVEGNMPEWEGKFIYKLTLNESKLIQLKTPEELDEFTIRFGFIKGKPVKHIYPNDTMDYIDTIGRYCYIDWNMVSQLYAGVEITPYQYERRLSLHWYYGWDVASGCIWNKTAINKIVKISP